jgi:hypothetical protein
MSFEKLTSPEGATIMHWSCDEGCGASANVETESFHAAWEALKAQHRWTAAKDRNGEWLHTCGKCQRSVSDWLART